MQKIKMLIVAIFTVVFFLVFLLPSNREAVLQSQVESLPDYNFLGAASRERASGDAGAAVTLLDIVIEQGLPNREQALTAREEIVKELLKGKDEMAQVRRAGISDDGRKRSWETAGGGSAAEAFSDVDGGKLLRQLKLNQGDKAFKKTLDPLKVLGDLWPRTNEALIVLVAARGEGALTKAMGAELASPIKTLSKSKEMTAPEVKAVLDRVIPVWELLDTCPTWTRFKTFMSFVENSRQLETLLSLVKSDPLLANDLHQILAVVATEPRHARDVLGYVVERGGAGVASLSAVIRKGPAGFNFIVEHPGFAPTRLKAPGFWGGNIFKRLWLRSLGRFPMTMEVVRYVVLWLVGSVVILLIVPDKNVIHACGLIAILLLLVFVFNYFSNGGEPVPPRGGPGPAAFAPGAPGDGVPTSYGAPAAPAPSQTNLNALSMLILLVIIFIQFAIYMRAVSELKSIKTLRSTYEGKLKQLENVDIFFDLPLYLGLLGTVTAFVIIIFDPGASRLVAYTSTIAGIIISALLRVFYLYPYRAELITHIDQYQKFKAENR